MFTLVSLEPETMSAHCRQSKMNIGLHGFGLESTGEISSTSTWYHSEDQIRATIPTPMKNVCCSVWAGLKKFNFWNRNAKGYCGQQDLFKYGSVGVCSWAGDWRWVTGREEAGRWVVQYRVRRLTSQPQVSSGRSPACYYSQSRSQASRKVLDTQKRSG